MNDFIIVPMETEAEMDEKGYVHWKAWHETYSGLMPDEYLEKITEEKCAAMAHRFSKNTLLLKVNNRVVGFACYRISEAPNEANELMALYLLKEYHGRKMGYALANAVFEKLSKDRKTFLWVLKGNDRAIRFYERYGFSFTGEEKEAPFGVELKMEIIK